MDKKTYFLKALGSETYKYKRWVLSAFSVVMAGEIDPNTIIPYQIVPGDSTWMFYNPEDGMQLTAIDGTSISEPPFRFDEIITLEPGAIANVDRKVETTYGNLLVNQLVLVYAFGDKIPFMEGRITVPRIEKIIEGRLRDNPKEGEVEEPNAIYVFEYQRYNEAMFSLAGYTQLCVPSATAKTMTTDPKIKERRAELLEQNKDRLHDPVVQAHIDAELIAMDKAWLKGDPGEGFYIKDKSYDIVRKKTFLLQGSEQGFGVQGEVIPTSLNEGWDVKYLPAMGNSLREGSYNRGALTALGGEATKFNYRIFQNTVISEEDCGSTFGMEIVLSKDDKDAYLSNSVVTPSGSVEITEQNFESFVGKKIRIRSPIYCRTSGANFCATCMGKKVASTPNAISTYAADIGSTFMYIMLKSMHGKSLTLAKFDLQSAIN